MRTLTRIHTALWLCCIFLQPKYKHRQILGKKVGQRHHSCLGYRHKKQLDTATRFFTHCQEVFSASSPTGSAFRFVVALMCQKEPGTLVTLMYLCGVGNKKEVRGTNMLL